MRPSTRHLALTAHIVFSVGWLGAVAAFLVLAIAGLVAENGDTVRAAYSAMELTGWFVLVPLSVASLLTGIVLGLGTTWGLVRHYWVVIKLAINLVATGVLLLYMQTLGFLGDLAADSADAAALRDASPALHSGAALGLLLVATTLAVYKPRGLTPYGWRKQQEERRA